MGKTRMERAGSYVLVILSTLTVAGLAVAQAPRGLGANTGDASTPFTGLASAPEASLFVGAATTSIPIEVPPGRKNLTPKLALTYNSSGGPSAYGYGWDLPLGKIQRSTKHGLLSCTDPPNDFVLALPGANVECTLAADGWCHPVIEESFMRIRYTANQWDVWDKSGLHYVFGATHEARTGNTTSTLFAPGPHCWYTFSWGLSKIEDPNGNTLEISYTKDASGVSYPSYIDYGGNSATGKAHLFRVNFVWTSPRPGGDAIVNSMGGFPAQLTKLLSRIEVNYLVDGSRVRSYSLQYEFPTDAEDRIGRQSFLSGVTLLDKDDMALARADLDPDHLPAHMPAQTKFIYQQNDPGSRRFGFGNVQYVYSELSSAPGDGWLDNYLQYSWNDDPLFPSWTYTDRDILDMDGDGFPDFVVSACGGTWSVYRGSKDGFSSVATPWAVPFGACHIRQVHAETQPLCGSDNGDGWTTISDTLDIDGDGIADYVDASEGTWTPSHNWAVFRGGGDSSTGWGFQDAQHKLNWAAPKYGLERSVLHAQLGSDADGTAVVTQLRDMNGDGLLDLVEAWGPDSCGGTWTVWLNNKSGFTQPTPKIQIGGLSNCFAFTTSDGKTLLGTFDVNGDGLPDYVQANDTLPQWDVWLNNGRLGFNSSEPWSVPSAGYAITWAMNEDDVWRNTVRDFFDINGDGLPDLVDADPTNGLWNVRLNRGDGFSSDALPWTVPEEICGGYIRQSYVHGSYSVMCNTLDIDGDGLVDYITVPIVQDSDHVYYHIYHNAGGAWQPPPATPTSWDGPLPTPTVAPNPGGARPDVLVSIDNGIGGMTDLAYRPSTQWDNTDSNGVPRLPFPIWTVTHIEQDDGMKEVSAGNHTITTDLTYHYGLFDPASREFRGFRVVDRMDSDLNLQRTWFHQDAARKGKVHQTSTYAAGVDPDVGSPLKTDVNGWQCADPTSGNGSLCPDVIVPPQRVWVRLSTATQYDYDTDCSPGTCPTRSAGTKNWSWDTYGNVTHSSKGGLNTATVHTYASYTAHDNANAYIVDKPAHVWTSDTGLLEEKWFTYDAGSVTKGNVTEVESWLNSGSDQGVPQPAACSQDGSKNCVSTDMTYDAYGNIIAVTDANSHRTETDYDTVTQIYPYKVRQPRVHNPPDPYITMEAATLYDPKCGKLRWQTVPYLAGQDPTVQLRTETQYDSFCRPEVTALPDETLTNPHRLYYYNLGAPGQRGAPGQATDVRIGEVVGGTSGPTSMWAYRDELFDALGRHMQTQRDGVVEGVVTTVADGTSTFDERGKVAARYAPYTVAQTYSNGAAVYQGPPAGTGVETLQYDALGRVTTATNPDDSFRSMDYSIAWQTTAKDECYNAPPCVGGKVTEIRDAFGRVIKKDAYEQDTLKSATQYTYDGLGRLLTSEQWNGTDDTTWNAATVISIGYDSLGRKISMHDPDSGDWRYGYDFVGNLIFQDDPKSATSTPPSPQHVEFCYDAVNRVKEKYYRTTQDSYEAVDCATPGNVHYTYDDPTVPYGLGRLTRVDDASGSTLLHAYDVRGRVLSEEKQIVDVDDGQTRNATTQYGYDLADHLAQIIYPDGEKVRYTYDDVGQVKRLAQDPIYGSLVYLNNLTYDIFGRPLIITHGNGTTDTRSYGDPTTNFRLSSIVTTQQGGLTHLNLNYRAYSPTGLLTELDDLRSEPVSNSAVYTYDGLRRLQAVTNEGQYQYDYLGNMTNKAGTALAYDNVHPHRLTQINGDSTNVSHDDNGNRMGKLGQAYEYDGDDHLKHVAAGSDVSFTYDYSGRRVATKSGTAVTRYYNQYAEGEGGYLTKYYYAGGMLVASQRGWDAQVAAVPYEPAVQVAGDPSGRSLLLMVRVRPDVQLGVAAILLLSAFALVRVPGRRKRVVGMAVRRGHVFLVVMTFGLTALPVPIVVEPAWAGGGGGGGGATSTPTQTPTATPVGMSTTSFTLGVCCDDRDGTTNCGSTNCGDDSACSNGQVCSGSADSDWYTDGNGSTYPPAYSACVDAAYGELLLVGKSWWGAPFNGYYVRNLLVKWHTGGHIPANATITSAYVSAYVDAGSVCNSNNRQITAGYVNWDSPTAGCDGSDYTTGVDSTAISGTPIASLAAGQTNVFFLNNVNNISTTGDTYLRWDVSDGAPSGQNEIHVGARGWTAHAGMRLTVNYIVPSPTPTLTPTPTPTALGGASTLGVKHYHLDHLGSPEVITNPDGSIFEQIRYTSYGTPRGHYDANGTLQTVNTCGDDGYCREFTGYDTEPVSGLQYAGARFYDPALGMFLTHDPARQFASPYTYTNWNPTNETDPNGACLWDFCIGEALLIAGIASSIAFTTTYVQARLNGASNGQALEAGAISGAIGAVAGAGLGLLAPAAGTEASFAYHAVLIQAGVVTTAQSFGSGQYAAGSVGLVMIALGLYMDAQGPQGASKTGGSPETEGGEFDYASSGPDTSGSLSLGERHLETQINAKAYAVYNAGLHGSAGYQAGLNEFASLGGRINVDPSFADFGEINGPDFVYHIPGVRYLYTRLFTPVVTIGRGLTNTNYYSFAEFQSTLAHEIGGHFYLGLYDYSGAFTTYDFEAYELRYMQQ